jgi:adenylate kinase family enzyme
MRIAVLGNSGSGKSTLARWLVARHGAAMLDLDTVAWEPRQIAVAREASQARADVARFCQSHDSWVIEGCYAGLVEACLPFRPTLIFLNPGAEVCLAHCRGRPWEPHKYASQQEQDARLGFLLSWVQEYYVRDGDLSLSGHRLCFDRYDGPKAEFVRRVELDPPDGRLLGLLQ